MGSILLPKHIYENQLPAFLMQLGSQNGDGKVTIDWSRADSMIPGATVALLAALHAWALDGKRIAFLNHSRCPAYKYLERMNFFRQCGLSELVLGPPHEPDGRFVPITRVGRGMTVEHGEICTSVASCIAPEAADLFKAEIYDAPEKTGAFDYIEYAVSELVTNVSHHSKAHGFLFAQFYPRTGIARLGIADCGIGILGSFKDSGSPHWHPNMTELDAIRKAIEPKVSSKNHRSTAWGESMNAGVGLTLLETMTRSIEGGGFCICSGDGLYELDYERMVPGDCRFPGTLCAVAVKTSSLVSFEILLRQAKIATGLLSQRDPYSGLFK